MLRKLRVITASIIFLLITLLFLDFTGTIHAWFGWLATIQFLPAVLALHFVVVVFFILLTLLFGRIYCSIICPLGVFQDVISNIAGRFHKNRFTHSKAKNWLRYSILVIFIASLVAGLSSIAIIVAPYSMYGRIANNLFLPVYQAGNNILAYLAERADSYCFYEVDIWIKSIPTFVIATISFIAIVILAWRNGRTYCNTICPVGTVLGFFSRFALFRPTIDTSKCVACGQCSRKCKSSCIDSKLKEIDYSRCVTCFDCIDSCKLKAIRYTRRPSKKAINTANDSKCDTRRRSFIATAGAMAVTGIIKAESKTVDGGLAVIQDKAIPVRNSHIIPPGGVSAKHLAQHCTACQLCVSACPNGVLRPSSSLDRLMQPESSYEYGYCRPECVRCSEVCPAGAIRPIDVAEKSSIQIGYAVWIRKNCIPLIDNVECGNCARHCPTGAIQMVNSVAGDETSVKIPVINTERCIGCGACENLCPARPFSAIYVEGNSVHRTL